MLADFTSKASFCLQIRTSAETSASTNPASVHAFPAILASSPSFLRLFLFPDLLGRSLLSSLLSCTFTRAEKKPRLLRGYYRNKRFLALRGALCCLDKRARSAHAGRRPLRLTRGVSALTGPRLR